MADDAPHNSESRLIAGSLKAIERDHPHVWAVVTYAAEDAGHVGYVYQATNAIYTGTGGHAVIYTDSDGKRRSDYLVGAYVSASRAESLGWQVTDGLPKHRYVYILGNRTERKQRRRLFRYDEHPYPKGTTISGSVAD